MKRLTSLELCAGAGGQALGLEQAGFSHIALIENDSHPCNTLKLNRPNWNVIKADLRAFDAREFKGIDMVAGGVPCQPFSSGGKQLGCLDERDLFPEVIRIISECLPNFILLENVRGLSSIKFNNYRNWIISELNYLGYYCEWKVINSAEYGVSQARLRFILVGRKDKEVLFPWTKSIVKTNTVGEVLRDLMGTKGWLGLNDWVKKANQIAPCLVGGSKKHGGADLGPQRAKKEWLELGIDGKSIANEAPERDFLGLPRLTNRMAARLQGFPDDWYFSGGKTAVYRQIGNAFPPPVAKAFGIAFYKWLYIENNSSEKSEQLELPLVFS
ncbi:DNA-methyltransferase Dcm [Rivularia sp. PCC 7116]|uniref:DNA cytosine methyltransferase n=1 Tax=Rivularia sp. PCC 7116 TaxID=373994 RepID=UPI00029F33AA|nr:DNA cytosine methyltransferase [Rivularia sp. PCC 7116]AFY55570.1 DNA-methyltransferase Dcm [Rivularia sp. PCC 7116]